MKKGFTEEQIIWILQEAEQSSNTRDVCRKHNVTEQTFYRWRNKYGGMDVSEARRLTDRGKEYYANDYQVLLKDNGLVCSISRLGNCYDNAALSRVE